MGVSKAAAIQMRPGPIGKTRSLSRWSAGGANGAYVQTPEMTMRLARQRGAAPCSASGNRSRLRAAQRLPPNSPFIFTSARTPSRLQHALDRALLKRGELVATYDRSTCDVDLDNGETGAMAAHERASAVVAETAEANTASPLLRSAFPQLFRAWPWPAPSTDRARRLHAPDRRGALVCCSGPAPSKMAPGDRSRARGCMKMAAKPTAIPRSSIPGHIVADAGDRPGTSMPT
jgi:hypothetical protein